MPNRSYQLANPIIEGTFKNVYDAPTPITAADEMWKNLTEHIVSHVPNFMFTLKDVSSGRYYNFTVTENAVDSSYTIEKTPNISAGKKEFTELLTSIDNYNKVCEQKGGKSRKRYDKSSDSDSSSSSSSSERPYPLLLRTSPIAMFHYNPYIYYKNRSTILNPEIVAITTPIFTPVFKPYLGTFIGIWP